MFDFLFLFMNMCLLLLLMVFDVSQYKLMKINDEDGMLMKEEDEEMGKILVIDGLFWHTMDFHGPTVLFLKNRSNDLN